MLPGYRTSNGIKQNSRFPALQVIPSNKARGSMDSYDKFSATTIHSHQPAMSLCHKFWLLIINLAVPQSLLKGTLSANKPSRHATKSARSAKWTIILHPATPPCHLSRPCHLAIVHAWGARGEATRVLGDSTIQPCHAFPSSKIKKPCLPIHADSSMPSKQSIHVSKP